MAFDRVLQARPFATFTHEATGEGSETLRVCNPVAVPGAEGVRLAPRLETLNNKRIAFFWNSKPGGDVALRRVEERLREQFPDIVTKQLQWEHHQGGGVIPLKEVMPFEPDAVVASTADCAVSVGTAADLIALEDLGIPTVVITAEHFQDSVQQQAVFSGLVEPLPTAIVPDPLTNISSTAIVRNIDACLEEIISGLTRSFDEIINGLSTNKVGQMSNGDVERRPKSNYLIYRGVDEWDAWDRMNVSFLSYGIGDGLPIVPPTRHRVDIMMAAAAEDPGKEIALLGLGHGSATVEKIAINAVMAGCQPRHFSVVLAAVRAIADAGFPLCGLAGSTTAHSTMLIVNGPIAKELKINSGVCCLGPGAASHSNVAIGRAIRLIQMNIAFQWPGITDLDYLGAGNKFSLCFAESEEANPWEPLHVERGFPPGSSTVSAIAVDSQSEGRSASPEPELILRAMAAAIATPTTTGSTIWMDTAVANSPVIVLSSTHAKALKRAGWNKRDVKQFLYYHSRVPPFFFKKCSSRNGEQLSRAWKWLNDADDTTLVPIATSADAFQIVVVDGEGPKSASFTAIPGIVTVPI